MTNAQRLLTAAALLADRASSKPHTAELAALRIHQEVLESLNSTGVLTTSTPKAPKAPKGSKKASKASTAAPASTTSAGAESAAE